MSEIDMEGSHTAAPVPSTSVPSGSDGLQATPTRTARAASITGLRQGLTTGFAAITTAVVARLLGASGYGYFAGGMAAFQLSLAFTDLSFIFVMTREMASHPADRGNLMRSTVQVQLVWSTIMAIVLIGFGLVTGGLRGEVMLVLAPAVLLSGLGPVRQVFLVTFTVGRLFIVDLLCAMLQTVLMVTAALLKLGLVAIAGASTLAMAINQIAGTVLGWGLVDKAPATGAQRRRVTRLALPLGTASIIASLYFTIDQVLLIWLVPAADLGYYAAAVKLLTVVVVIPGFIMQAGIPALAQARGDRAQLSDVAGRLAHWIAATALPLCVGLAIFAHPVVEIIYGPKFAPAVSLLRVLMIAGTLALGSNVGIILGVVGIVRPQLIFNTSTLVVNVVGNILLVPRFGISASAWLTAGCEAIIVSYGLVALRHRVYLSRVIAPSVRMLLAIAASAAAGLALTSRPLLGIPVSIGLFVALVMILRAWPADLTPARFRRQAS